VTNEHDALIIFTQKISNVTSYLRFALVKTMPNPSKEHLVLSLFNNDLLTAKVI
jgi:hypothetical protein